MSEPIQGEPNLWQDSKLFEQELESSIKAAQDHFEVSDSLILLHPSTMLKAPDTCFHKFFHYQLGLLVCILHPPFVEETNVRPKHVLLSGLTDLFGRWQVIIVLVGMFGHVRGFQSRVYNIRAILGSIR